ncbi:peptidase M18, aminopeptidase I [Rhizophagus irregularis]|uniref:aspartyl aminopeptidase n=1 Tax=Rhizophagus irregularis TaxID=588596 RepID=A0A2N0RNJ0_9GLOM|nr:peptidase M18, aminopeptidase I [Rhizophagus irregularis]
MKYHNSTQDNNSTSAADFIKFVNNSPSPFHAVEEAIIRLKEAKYEEIKECVSWRGKLKKEGKYYFTRNRSTIVAFAIGGKYEPGNGFSMAGAHTDSPCLKVKPISKKVKEGYLQVGVEPYGGGLWHTWFDRDLSVAGRVMVETETTKFEHKLVKVERPILRIPTLAIHLDRDVREGFKFNNEVHLTPLIATVSNKLAENNEKHHPALLDILAQELKCKVNEIHDFELCLYDTQPSTIGGAYEEFIFSARLDNLMMSYALLIGLINSTKNISESLCDDSNIRLITLFDNEEIGSTTAHGANSLLLETTLRRICSAFAEPGYDTIFEETIHKSFMISADMAHAVHPNYCEKHEENHRPQMNQGVVIKTNANQASDLIQYHRYATTSVTSLILRQVAKKYKVPLQDFVVRNDSPCGSTIGPMISANLGLRTLDIGNPQLSMHSIRETAGTKDVDHAIKLIKAFFEDFAEIDRNITVD